MITRESIRKYIVSHGGKPSRFRSWEQSAESEGKGLLREHLPSGYSSWFAIVEGKSIWWAYSDSSDGRVWTSEGVAITGYWETGDRKRGTDHDYDAGRLQVNSKSWSVPPFLSPVSLPYFTANHGWNWKINYARACNIAMMHGTGG
jgi:hypothetical protein